MTKNISRQQFLQRTAMAGAAVLLSSLESFALNKKDKKIRIAVIGCGSVSGKYLPHLSKASFVEPLYDIPKTQATMYGNRELR
jgi:hypothetical protein